MNKKAISIMSVMLIVFLCFPFKAFAVTGGGKTITSNSYSYNNGAVTVYVRVNGNAGEENYTGGNRMYSYPHSFTVTLANNSNDFQVADTNNFTIDLYSGSSSTFASYQNSWGSEVTSYSDNMTAPRILMYPSGDLAGHVLVSFSDGDLLVLNPNETRTYNFTINFIQYENVNYTPLNGNVTYSYFTYTGNVDFYTRPASFSGNTIEDFINNDSIPNSAIAWLIAQYNQGNITNNELLDVIDIINSHTLLDNSYTLNGYNTIRNSSTSTASSVARTTSVFTTNPYIVDREFSNYNGYADYDVIVCVPYYRFYSLNNTRSDISVISASDYSRCYNPLIITSNYNYLGSKVEYLTGEGMMPTGITDQYRFWFQPSQGSRFILGPNARYYYFWVEYLYFGYSGSSIPVFTFNISSTISSDPGSFNTYTDDIIDASNDINDEVANQHTQEQQYYTDTNTAIADTGISNYSFDSQQVGGLNGVSDDFTRVWNACGSLNSVWVFSITLSLALFILRHHKVKTS